MCKGDNNLSKEKCSLLHKWHHFSKFTHFVIHIGEIANIKNFVSQMPQISVQQKLANHYTNGKICIYIAEVSSTSLFSDQSRVSNWGEK